MKTELIFSGDDLLIQKFPDHVDIIYPNPPLPPLKNFKSTIEAALDNPLECAPLKELVDSTSKVCIGFDDVSVPLPLVRPPDPRSLVIEAILKRLKNLGVLKENVSLICATGLHRKSKPKEIRNLVGKKVMREYRTQIRNHDVEETVRLETLPSGIFIDLNETAANTDLIIYVSIPYTPMNGGYKSVAVGMGSVESILQNHIPSVLEISPLMDPNHSEMHRIIQTVGQEIEKKIPIFQVEIPLNNAFYSSVFRWLWKPIHGKISLFRKIALGISKNAPSRMKRMIRTRYRANYQPIGIFAGKVSTVHQEALKLVQKQMIVEVPHQYDVIVLGIPNITPYNIGTDPNPILIHALINGYLINAYQGQSVLKKKGVIIAFNPCRLAFDEKQHAAYRTVFNKLTPEPIPSRGDELEQFLINHKEFLDLYRNKFAFHPLHPLLAYYWGTKGCSLASKSFIVTKMAKDKFPLKMGWEPVSSFEQALVKAKEVMNRSNISIVYPFIPPVSLYQPK